MATVKAVRAILGPGNDAEVTGAKVASGAVHVKGFVTSSDLRVLVKRYDVMLHSDGALCVE